MKGINVNDRAARRIFHTYGMSNLSYKTVQNMRKNDCVEILLKGDSGDKLVFMNKSVYDNAFVISYADDVTNEDLVNRYKITKGKRRSTF